MKMTRTTVLAALLAGLIAGPAQASDLFLNQNCMSADSLRDYLDQAFDEGPAISGTLENGNPMQLFVSRSGTWTLVEIQEGGIGCVHASGDNIRLEPGAFQTIALPRARS